MHDAPPPISDALDVLDGHLSDVRRVKDWAALHGYTRAAFTRAFKAEFGRAPGRVLRQRRLERARHLLAETSLSCYRVARQIGLRDEKALYAFMKAHTGKSPRELRCR